MLMQEFASAWDFRSGLSCHGKLRRGQSFPPFLERFANFAQTRFSSALSGFVKLHDLDGDVQVFGLVVPQQTRTGYAIQSAEHSEGYQPRGAENQSATSYIAHSKVRISRLGKS